MKDLIEAICNVLSDMSVLAEGKGTAFDRPVITQGESEHGNRPQGPSKTLYDRQLELLLQWLKESQDALANARKTPERIDWRAWVIKHYEGEDYTSVAVEEGVHPTYIRKIRVEARRNPNDGSRKLEAA